MIILGLLERERLNLARRPFSTLTGRPARTWTWTRTRTWSAALSLHFHSNSPLLSISTPLPAQLGFQPELELELETQTPTRTGADITTSRIIFTLANLAAERSMMDDGRAPSAPAQRERPAAESKGAHLRRLLRKWAAAAAEPGGRPAALTSVCAANARDLWRPRSGPARAHARSPAKRANIN